MKLKIKIVGVKKYKLPERFFAFSEKGLIGDKIIYNIDKIDVIKDRIDLS